MNTETEYTAEARDGGKTGKRRPLGSSRQQTKEQKRQYEVGTPGESLTANHTNTFDYEGIIASSENLLYLIMNEIRSKQFVTD